MKKIVLLTVLLLLIAVVGCSFNEVEDVTLSFYDGKKLIETTTLYKYNKNPFVPPEKEGFEFTRWYLDSACTQPCEFDKIKSDSILYAGWIEKSDGLRYYHIVFCSDDGTMLKQMNVNKIEDLIFPEVPVKEGYAFIGWDNIPTGQLSSDLIIYAKYAKEYTVEFFADANDTSPLSHQIVLEGNSAVAPSEPTKSGDAQYYYTFSGWSVSFDNVTSDLKIVAKFTRNTHKYTYTFKNYDGTVLVSKSVNYGSKITQPTATKESDDTYVYTFIGWDLNNDNVADTLPETIVENFEAVALFSTNYKAFTVNFFVDETIIESVNVTYGNPVEYTGDTPTKESDVRYNYTFIGWDKTFENITENTDVYALFESTTRQYTYSFVDFTGLVVTETADYGTIIIAPTPHEKEQTDEFEYPFANWSDYAEGMILDADYTFEAIYTPTKRLYTYTFYVGKTIIARVTAEYGTVIVAPEAPEAPDGSKFDKWIGFTEGMILTKDISFNARFV